MNINISDRIRIKIRNKHRVTIDEVEECFINHTGHFLIDDRERHRTHPPTEWFIAETNAGRALKIVFIEEFDGTITLKTAFEPNSTEKKIYDEYTPK